MMDLPISLLACLIVNEEFERIDLGAIADGFATGALE
jgi:hypothetical protein